ncbi:RWD domain-containing protein [Haematococcus lacustris]|uniref:RWD domain-containing protein n=1 Tax=Haematococcus lacustris TaxID=44745 RepID=A0A699ZXB6_HAELA|nr:RWD domain-containing protein [Haematococcus lacustris]
MKGASRGSADAEQTKGKASEAQSTGGVVQQVADAQRVVVVVTRWYGGVQLGPARFTLINNVARTLLEQQGFICPGGRAHGAGGDAKRAGRIGLNNARRTTQRWLAPIKPHLQHLAAASSAGTSLEANQKHITVTLATWDAVWELEEDMAEVSMERHGRAKQLVVFFGAASIGTAGGWGADAVLRACCKAPRSSQAATQPAASERGPSSPPPAKRSKRIKAEQAAEPTNGEGKAKSKAAKAKPAPQPGRGRAMM